MSKYKEIGREAAAAGLDEAVENGIPIASAIGELRRDLLAEMDAWDQSDPRYPDWMEEYRGMLLRCD